MIPYDNMNYSFSMKALMITSFVQIPTENVLKIMALPVVLMLCVNGWLLWAKRFKTEKNLTELTSRVKTFWIILALLALSLLLKSSVAVVFWAIMSYLALKEYFAIIPTRQIDRRVFFWAYVAIPIQYFWIASGWYNMFVIFIPVYVFLFLPLRMVILGETKGFLRAVGTIH